MIAWLLLGMSILTAPGVILLLPPLHPRPPGTVMATVDQLAELERHERLRSHAGWCYVYASLLYLACSTVIALAPPTLPLMAPIAMGACYLTAMGVARTWPD